MSEPKRRFAVPGPIGLGLLVVWLGLAASCGQGFDRAAAVDSVERAHPELTAVQVDCVTDRLIDRYGLDGLADELDGGEGSEPSAELVDARYNAMFTCGVEGDVATVLAEQLEASGVPADGAACVAARLTADLDDEAVDVLLSGEITEDYLAEFAAAMEACEA